MHSVLYTAPVRSKGWCPEHGFVEHDPEDWGKAKSAKREWISVKNVSYRSFRELKVMF